jgi:tRNA (guanine-N7-)-methyltransferase
LATYWRVYGVEGVGPLHLPGLFGREAPCHLEIGFGMGDALAELAQAHPERNYLGVDVHEAGIGRLLHLLAERGLDNVRVARGDAVSLLRERIALRALDAVLVFFPDPWPKKRHHKRRLIQPPFVDLLASRLTAGGLLHLATDWAPYATWMLEAIEPSGCFVNEADSGHFAPDPGERPTTRFERRGERLGHGIVDLRFRRAPDQA